MKGNSKFEVKLNIEELKKKLSNLKNHRFNHVNQILPFTTSSVNPPIKHQFEDALGYFVRYLHNIKVSKEAKEELHIDNIIKNMEDKVVFKTEEDKQRFYQFVKRILFEDQRIKIIYPNLYIYHLPTKHGKDMDKYGKFMSDIFIDDTSNFKEVFSVKNQNDILLQLIMDSLSNIKFQELNSEQQYRSLVPKLTKQYKKDLIYLSRYKDYFMNAFPLITRYYIFMYTCQLIFKFEQFTHADFDKINIFYFALDWESISQKRSASSGPQSYKWIQEHSIKLFSHMHAMAHLSTNTLNTKKGERYKFMTYSEIFCNLSKFPENVMNDFVNGINEWIKVYPDLKMVTRPVEVESHNTNFVDAVKELQRALSCGMNIDAQERFGKHVEHLGKDFFIKSRGRLGFVFNITHEFLLLLTAVSVKDYRLSVNELFQEFEKRGIGLDDRSKEEVIRYLDSLNYIDKKSDSGDARYVKSIL